MCIAVLANVAVIKFLMCKLLSLQKFDVAWSRNYKAIDLHFFKIKKFMLICCMIFS